jgi:cation transport regulator ChaC
MSPPISTSASRPEKKEKFGADFREMYVFGYGSLIWKVDFPYESRQPGYIRGFVRRFWQKSTDHRGTPESPGRVVTLIPYEEWTTRFAHMDPHTHAEGDICWGMVYKIAEKGIEDVRGHLDFREKDGYQTFHTHVYHPTGPKDPTTGELKPLIEDAVLYIATTTNPSFAGPTATIDDLAFEIARRRGPSGPNAECIEFHSKNLAEIKLT